MTAWQGKLKTSELTILESLDPTAEETAKQGMALFRVADDLYLQRRYRVLQSQATSGVPALDSDGVVRAPIPSSQ